MYTTYNIITTDYILFNNYCPHCERLVTIFDFNNQLFEIEIYCSNQIYSYKFALSIDIIIMRIVPF